MQPMMQPTMQPTMQPQIQPQMQPQLMGGFGGSVGGQQPFMSSGQQSLASNPFAVSTLRMHTQSEVDWWIAEERMNSKFCGF